ncbi:unnamed protein product [Vitrella brassicaformis CCMP3155]|uniref:Potassium channel tetramerisation-type BTB domain-containing protein n=2 Tax=Vitrella brassicaformis TaxID=1169539 RepID=A0A0G4FW19_VITBC|nr:unnamed protein product [Vitrella brassicaformis CCMP3155]|eukprot:CEM19389.1 unnamed protein product [Vitrella brassicaformis CCMP3155]
MKSAMTSSPATTIRSSSSGSSQTMKINVGGRVIDFPVAELLRSEWQGTPIAVLLHWFEDWLLTDDNGIPFVDADPEYFIRLAGLLRGVEGCALHLWEFPEYRLRFLAVTSMSTDTQAQSSPAPPDLTVNAQPGDESSDDFRDFKAVMGPFIKTECGGTGGREVKTMTFTDGSTGTCVVSTTDATLEHFEGLRGRFDRDRFCTTVSGGTGETVEQFQKQVLHFQKVVDWARRIRISGDGGIEGAGPAYPPSSDDPRGLADACEMYGIFEQAYRCILGKKYNIRHLYTSCAGKEHAVPYADLLDHLGGGGSSRGRLMVLETNNAERLICHIDGPLPLRTDSTCPQLTGRKVTLHRMTMKEGNIITTTLPPEDDRQHDHFVVAAGVHGGVTGAIKATNDETVKGRVALAGGRVWLGVGKDDDMRKCRVCLDPSAEET